MGILTATSVKCQICWEFKSTPLQVIDAKKKKKKQLMTSQIPSYKEEYV